MIYVNPFIYFQILVDASGYDALSTAYDEQVDKSVVISEVLSKRDIFTESNILMQCLTDQSIICILFMDEMFLTSNLFCNESTDSILGFEDLGEGESSNLAANTVLCLWFIGILGSWKLPIFYNFVNEPLRGEVLKEIIENNLLQWA